MKLEIGAGAVLAVAGLGVLGLVAWRAARDGTLSKAANLVNPASPDNLVYQGVNAVGGGLVTDPAGPGKNADGSWSLGGFLYDWTHPDAFNTDRPRYPSTGGATGSWDDAPESQPYGLPPYYGA